MGIKKGFTRAREALVLLVRPERIEPYLLVRSRAILDTKLQNRTLISSPLGPSKNYLQTTTDPYHETTQTARKYWKIQKI